MPQPVPLSDGTVVFAPDDATPEALNSYKMGGEAQIARTYMQKAAETGAPFIPPKYQADGTTAPGDTVYSATGAYPNSAYGRAMATLDHAGGDAVNQITRADPMGGGTLGSLTRIGTNVLPAALAPTVDPALAGLNIAKSRLGGTQDPVSAALGRPGLIQPGQAPTAEQEAYRSPVQKGLAYLLGPGDTSEGGVLSGLRRYATTPQGEADTGRIPLVGEQLRSDIGAPELGPDASTAQRIGEATLTALGARGLSRVLPGASAAAPAAAGAAAAGAVPSATSSASAIRDLGSAALRDLVYSTTGTVAGDWAQRNFGDVGGYLAGLAAGGAVPWGHVVPYTLGKVAARPETEGGLPQSAPAVFQAGRQEGFMPSFKAMARPAWQRFAEFFGALPFGAGAPIARMDEDTARNILRVRNQAAADVAGGPGAIPPLGATAEDIGGSMIEGARAAVPAVQAQRAAPFAPIEQAVGQRSFDVAPAITNLNQRLSQSPLTEPTENALRGYANLLTQKAPGAPGSQVQGPPSAPGAIDVPWSVGKDWLTNTSNLLGPGPLEAAKGRAETGAIQQDVLSAMANRAEQEQPGLGAAFRNARQQYAEIGRNVLDPLYKVTGEPVKGGAFGPAGAQQAYNYLLSNLNSPENIEPFARYSPNWGVTSGRYLSTLGGQGELFRPEHLAKGWTAIGPEVQSQMTGGAQFPGTPGMSQSRFQNAAIVGQGSAVPIARGGLRQSAATGVGIAEMLGKLGKGILGGTYVPARMISNVVASPITRRSMAGENLAPELAQGVYSNLPRIAALEEARRMQFGAQP